MKRWFGCTCHTLRGIRNPRCHCFNKTCTFGSLSAMETADGGGESPPDKKDSPTPALLVMEQNTRVSGVC
jgi:hypothetical protein